jgi:hypothetical protein
MGDDCLLTFVWHTIWFNYVYHYIYSIMDDIKILRHLLISKQQINKGNSYFIKRCNKIPIHMENILTTKQE